MNASPQLKSCLMVVFMMMMTSCQDQSHQKIQHQPVAEKTISGSIKSLEKKNQLAKTTAGRDTIRNIGATQMSEEAYQKATINLNDSTLTIYGNIRADYRIFGYEKPDTNSRKLILFSVFTTDVKGNPYRCPYGAYYATSEMQNTSITYIGSTGSFIKASVVQAQQVQIPVYILKDWVEFEK
ncbi:hypothetical protein FFJ24_008355 [Pedobacter sp. KBS0701]|uniref:hypothetical protein n=2 Tax=unclassified Pedobacter TaxID=2628915 RepID=UPI00110DF3AF|nr:hypothetical protein [Pedobacter sp. KBS0701]QDW24822.1 hypothetical protein FFJ24_008355 [Pedobacter sp. KBS0701]